MDRVSFKQKIDLLKANPCFSNLTNQELEELSHLLHEKIIPSHQTIVKENEVIDSIYFIDSGRAEVGHISVIDDRTDFTVVATLNPREAIGLSDTGFFSQSGLRTATVIALTEMVLLRLDIRAFDAFTKRNPHVDQCLKESSDLILKMNLIKRSIPFAKLTSENINSLAKEIKQIELKTGSIIFQKGDEGNECYLIQSGTIEIFLKLEKEEERLAILKSPMIFGEAAILMNAPRNASARVLRDCVLFVLSKESIMNIVQSKAEVASSLMSLLKTRARPRQQPYIETHYQETDGLEKVITLKDTQNDNYFRLSEEGSYIWERLDGRHTLRDLTLAFEQEYGIFDPGLISTFVMDLELSGFVTDIARTKKVVQESKIEKVITNIRRVMEASFSFGHVDEWLTRTYKAGIFIFYTYIAQILIAIITIIGLFFFVVSFDKHVQLMRVISNTGLFLILVIPLSMASGVIHELAHAYTTKAFGRKVKCFGLGWFWVGPMAFCDTSDMWLSSKGPRLAVDLAGMYVQLFLGAVAAILVLFISNPYVILLLWIFTLYMCLDVFYNLSPSIELDGYYTLMDLTGKENLREASIFWLYDDFKDCIKNPSLFKYYKSEMIYWLFTIFYLILEVIVPYFLLNSLLYGLFGITNPYISLIAPIIVISLSSFGIYYELKKKRALLKK